MGSIVYFRLNDNFPFFQLDKYVASNTETTSLIIPQSNCNKYKILVGIKNILSNEGDSFTQLLRSTNAKSLQK
jgi:hypothetical protein